MKITIKNRSDFAEKERYGFERLIRRHCLSTLYSELASKYQREYHNNIDFIDISFGVYIDSVLMAAFCGTLHSSSNDAWHLTFFGRPATLIQDPDLDFNIIKKNIRKHLEKPIQDYDVGNFLFIDHLYPSHTLSTASTFFLERGGCATLHYTRLIELSRAEEELKRNIRKSYKSLINWGHKHLRVEIHDQASTSAPEKMEEFRELHIAAAGRVTRPKATWDVLTEMITCGEAFLVLGYYEEKLVTGAFFSQNDKVACYGVGASNREMFDKPLSHCIIWTGILKAKENGCSFFDVGEQFFPCQMETVTKKEADISKFKSGFGGAPAATITIQKGDVPL